MRGVLVQRRNSSQKLRCLFNDFKPSKHAFPYFPCSLQTCSMTSYYVLVQSTQSFPNKDHNMITFSKDSIVSQNQFILKLICDLIINEISEFTVCLDAKNIEL